MASCQAFAQCLFVWLRLSENSTLMLLIHLDGLAYRLLDESSPIMSQFPQRSSSLSPWLPSTISAQRTAPVVLSHFSIAPYTNALHTVWNRSASRWSGQWICCRTTHRFSQFLCCYSYCTWRFLSEFVNVRKPLTTVVNILHHLANAWGGDGQRRTISVQISA